MIAGSCYGAEALTFGRMRWTFLSVSPLSHSARDGCNDMKFLSEEAAGCWILCWVPFQDNFLGEEIRCLVTRMSHMRFNPAVFNIWRIEKDVFKIKMSI
ncbi:hypothetical protein AVEN_144358-1 [Araneus ventricosus]|uniref:Uncharacterized protein n=1 Tax=Araneus ventricosus TaxID=182803 RepID=A0A4Y2RD84_ARAVE|nr:hypothetical protein AVEN_144358-1 [Araneus ventricosus]